MSSKNRQFTTLELDALGEILNISMGAAATAVSLLLDKKVSITTPNVEVIPSGEYSFDALKPAIAVEIEYIDGISGTNIMILKREDVMHIVGALLQQEFTLDTFVMDEMSISAICEVMNQMMGSSSTALTEFLNRSVNISTPRSYEINTDEGFTKKYFDDDEQIISVRFELNIEGLTSSEFASVLPNELAEELLELFSSDLNSEATADEEIVVDVPEVETQPQPVINESPAATPTPAAPAPAAPSAPATSHAAPPMPRSNRSNSVANASHEIHQPMLDVFSADSGLVEEQADNLKLIMSVPLQISVELGRSKKTIKEILELTTGSVVELGTQAGTPVDILVNNQFIAKGDVVMVDDYYGVRITEILNPNQIIETI